MIRRCIHCGREFEAKRVRVLVRAKRRRASELKSIPPVEDSDAR
jgi:hypothetical protein